MRRERNHCTAATTGCRDCFRDCATARMRASHQGSKKARLGVIVRFFASPLPVVLHIVAAAAHIVQRAFHFVPGIRRRSPGWHRRVGRLLVGSGLIATVSGLWMTQS
jgi:Predicted membrane protein (DUF2306)